MQQLDLTVATDYENMESKLFKKMNKQEEAYAEQYPALDSLEDKKELPKQASLPDPLGPVREFLLRLKAEILDQKWHVRVGEVGC